MIFHKKRAARAKEDKDNAQEEESALAVQWTLDNRKRTRTEEQTISFFSLSFFLLEDPLSQWYLSRVSEHEDHWIPPEEHLADEAVLVNRLRALSLGPLWHLSPHLLDVLQHHVAVTIKGLDSAEQLPVVAAADQDLAVVLHSLGQDWQWSSVELHLLNLTKLLLWQLNLSLPSHSRCWGRRDDEGRKKKKVFVIHFSFFYTFTFTFSFFFLVLFGIGYWVDYA